jgi:hypothetical protein
MVEYKQIKNSNKFREPAITFDTYGYYTSAAKGTKQYFDYWDEQMNRCLNGYKASDGDFITGYHYFYLNFCPITRLVHKMVTNELTGEVKDKTFDAHTFPDFHDYDYFFFLGVEEAEATGHHVAALKSRRKGYSLKASSMADRNFYLIPNSKTYIYTSDKTYLTGDGILTKAWAYMDFIDENTAWAKKRQKGDTMFKRRASVEYTDEYGNKIEKGYKSEIIGATLGGNPNKVRGKRGKLIIFEEAGSFKELGDAWQIARPSVEQDGETFGLLLAFGTGGDEASNFATLRDMFYNPEAYNCLGFENIWDLAPGDKKCGFFIPQYANLDNRRPDGTRLYMDKDGNTLVNEAKKYILELRKNEIEQSSNSAAVDRYIAERPITPSEAMLQFGGNIFPKKELQDRLALIRTNTKLQGTKQVGELHQTPEGRFVWTQKKFGDITTYPLDKKEDPTGSIVIWEHPEPDPPYGLYIIGVDPYDFDQSGTNSLGSCIVYKRFMNMDSYSDMIVAEYTGRPPAAEDFYEGVMKLALYYNANVMYENEKKGLYTYFATKHSDYLLADQPSILNDVIKNMTVNRKKGCHMNKQIKLWGEGLMMDWLLEKDQTGMRQLDKILSEPLLEELIQYYDDGNFDRVMALMQVLVYREQMYNTIIQEKVDENHREMFFGGPIFTNEDDAPDTRAPFFSFDYFRF